MKARYAPPVAIVGAIVLAAAGVATWPELVPVIAGVAVWPPAVAVVVVTIALVRHFNVGSGRALAGALVGVGVLAIALGAYGYWAHLVEGTAALWGAIGVIVGGAIVTVAGVSDWFEIETPAARRKTSAAVTATVLGFGGLAAIFVWANVLSIGPFIWSGGEPPEMQLIAVSQLSLGLGTGTIAGIYLAVTDRSWAFFDVRVPSLREVGWIVGGAIGLFAILIAANLLLTLVDAPVPEHGVVETARGNPDILLFLIPASLLIIGPGEELLFRNIVQKSLYANFSTIGAIVIASLIFGLAHFLAYGATASTASIMIVIFGLSLLLGGIYARTKNVVVPAIIHGLYNAVQFAALYIELTSSDAAWLVGFLA